MKCTKLADYRLLCHLRNFFSILYLKMYHHRPLIKIVQWYKVKIIKEAQHDRDRLHFLSPALLSSSHLDLRETGRSGGLLVAATALPYDSVMQTCSLGTGERLGTIWVR